MSDENIFSIKAMREARRNRTGWSLDEIAKRLKEERALYRQIGGKEPDVLASGGDMKKILAGDDE